MFDAESWHLLLWPRDDGELSEVMRWITVTHTQLWHAHRHSSGSGPVYQGRFKSFPVQTDEHFLTVARYVERNALRAGLVGRAEYWQWSSLWRFLREDGRPSKILSHWPMERPRAWINFVNESERQSELKDLRSSKVELFIVRGVTCRGKKKEKGENTFRSSWC